MSDPIHGSCLCGSVRFRIEGRFDAFFLCHCQRCRKATGSAHASNLFSGSATLEVLKGEDLMRTYQVPDTRHARAFCSCCGGALPNFQLGGAVLMVPAGCLDDPVDMRPVAHIFCADRANWDDALELVPQLDGAPQRPAALRG